MIKTKNPEFRKLLKRRGVTPTHAVKNAIEDANCRYETPALSISSIWIGKFMRSDEYKRLVRITGHQDNDFVQHLVRGCIQAVVNELVSISEHKDKMFAKIARNKTSDPKELTFYEAAIIADRIGIPNARLVDVILNGFDMGVEGFVRDNDPLEAELRELRKELGRQRTSNTATKNEIEIIKKERDELFKENSELKEKLR